MTTFPTRKEKAAACSRRWYHANKEKADAGTRRYREANKEKVLKQRRAHYAANKKKINEYHQRWRDTDRKSRDYTGYRKDCQSIMDRCDELLSKKCTLI